MISDNGTLVLDNTGTVTQGTTYFNGAGISGTGGLVQAGVGTLVLNTTNSYSGPTTISAGTLQLANLNALENSTLTNNVPGGVTFSSSGVYNLGGLAGSGGISMAYAGSGGLTLRVGSNNAATVYSGALTGSGALVKVGTNSLVLTGANTYTGNTTISAGSLQLGNGGAGGTLSGGSNATITDNGTLVFNNNGTLTQGTNFNNSVITGSGGLVQLGPGTTVMNLANSFSGNVTVSGGTLEANYNNGTNGLTAGPLGNMQVSTRSVTVGNGGTLLFPQANGMGGGGLTYLTPIIIQAGGIVSNTSSANVSIGPLTLAGGTLTAVGGTATWNSWDLNGAMTITVTGATNSAITVTGSNASSGMALAPSTTFNVAGPGNLIVSMPLVNQDGGGAAAALVKTGTGLMNVTGPADYSGGTTISGGTLEVSSGTLNNSLAGNISVASSATMEFNPSVAQTYNGVISGAGSVFTKGSFALTLTGANTFTGGLTIGGGTLNLGSFDAGTENTASLGAGSVAITGGGVLALGGTAGSGINYTATNSFTLNNGTIIAEDDLHTFTGTTTIGAGGGTIYTQLRDVVINNLTGSGPLAVDSMFINQTAAAGLVHLSGAGGYTGTVTINQPGVAGAAAGHGGEISVDSATALENAAVVMSGTRGMAFGAPDAVFGSLSGSGAFSLTTAGTLTVGNINTNSTYTGVMSGTGTLLKTGNGLLGLGGVNTYTGGTIVNGGTLQLNIGDAGPLAGGSTVFVNSGATLLGNATDPLNYNGGGYTAVNLVINDGTMFENAPYRATITSLNMTGGTLSSSAGTAANGNNYSLSGTWTVTSDAAGNPALADATDIGLNSGTLNVNRGPGAVDMLISSSIVNYNSSTLIKSGAGILELTGSNSYTGGTTVAAGILELGGTAATLVAPTAIVNMTGGTLDLHGFDPTVAAHQRGDGHDRRPGFNGLDPDHRLRRRQRHLPRHDSERRGHAVAAEGRQWNADPQRLEHVYGHDLRERRRPAVRQDQCSLWGEPEQLDPGVHHRRQFGHAGGEC